MSEYIEREVLQNAMYHEAFETDTEMQRWDSGCWIRYKLFENVLEQQPTVDVPQWIPCSEGLPEYDKEVLCFTTSKEIIVGHLDNEWGQNVWTTGEFAGGTFDALAWMPLPDPWEGEVDEQIY